MTQKTFRICNKLLNANDYKYSSILKLDFSMFPFSYKDYASIVSARLKNIRSNSGFFVVERTLISNSTVTTNTYELSFEP